MKTVLLILALAEAFLLRSGSTQDSGLSERFPQIDRDGDGKLSREEAGDRPFFRFADENEDGFVTWQELRDLFLNRRDREKEPTRPDSSLLLSADAPFLDRASSAAGYSESCGGTAVVVLRNGEVVFERYAEGVDEETAHHLHSGTKGFWGPAVAAMIEDGLIESFDELVSETLPEWRGDARKKTITLRHLLQLNAGLAQDLVKLQGHDRPTLAEDLYTHAAGLRLWTDPGARFAYGPSCYYALGAVLERKLQERGQNPLEYLKSRILDPIGVETGKWVHDKSGNPHIPNGAWFTARDWAKFGQFLLREGEWEGEQIVPAELLRELREPSRPNPGHGLALWLNRPGGFPPARQGFSPDTNAPGGFIYPDGEPDLFAALGAGKNRLFILPSRNMVVARQTVKDTSDFDDAAFLRLILGVPVAPAKMPVANALWITPEVRAPRVGFHTFASPAAATEVSYHLYTPEAYDREPERRFPVLYWLHGGGDKGWSGIPAVAARFDAMIRNESVPPLLIVFVNGLVRGMYCNRKDGSVPLETVIVQDLLPHIDNAHRTIAKPAGRVIEGFSMGGYGAGRLGFKYPHLFGGVSLLGAGPLQPKLEETPRVGIRGREEILRLVFGSDQDYFFAQSPWALAEKNAEDLQSGLRIRQVIGDRDETFAFNRKFHEHLDGLDIPHRWIVLPGIEHDPMGVLRSLGDANGDFYRAIFEPSPEPNSNSKP